MRGFLGRTIMISGYYVAFTTVAPGVMSWMISTSTLYHNNPSWFRRRNVHVHRRPQSPKKAPLTLNHQHINQYPFSSSSSAEMEDTTDEATTTLTTQQQELERERLKQELLNRVQTFQEALRKVNEVDDEKVSNATNTTTSQGRRNWGAPQKVNYYRISARVGHAADAILELCARMESYNPTAEPTQFLGDKEQGTLCPLNGPWKLLFTTASDATFLRNKNKKTKMMKKEDLKQRGEGDGTVTDNVDDTAAVTFTAVAQNIVDAARSRITNVIDFKPLGRENGGGNVKQPTLQQLNVVIKATAENKKRVALQFLYAKAKFNKFLFWPIPWNLYIPVPGTFITRLIVFFYRVFFRRTKKPPPRAYFDVLFLDQDLRIHKTGEDNLFVQARPSWKAAASLIEQ